MKRSNKRKTTQVRVTPETKVKISDLKRQLSAIEREDIKSAEILRRTFNIPNLKDVLARDSELKKRLKR